jgi:hypothetical protein
VRQSQAQPLKAFLFILHLRRPWPLLYGDIDDADALTADADETESFEELMMADG